MAKKLIRNTLFSVYASAVLLRANFPAHGGKLPQGEPPQPVGPRINVAEYGADLRDNDHDDTAALNAALTAATDHSTLYFPAGTYNVRWVDKITGFDGLSLQGDGSTESILKRMGPFWREGDEHTWENLKANFSTDSKLLRIEDCRNMAIRDLGFDANGTPTFGGVGIIRPRRLYITRTRYVDSQEQPPLFGMDRYAWCILGYEQGAEDIWFTDNVVEGLQTEMDSTRRVLVERCLFRRPVQSAGLGFLSGNFTAPAEFRDGYHTLDITVRNNCFTNSNVLSMGLLTFQLDPSTNCNSVFRDIDLVDNVFVYDRDSSIGHAAIKLGTGDNSQPTQGNLFERFRIEGNRIYRKPEVQINEEPFPAYIWFNCWVGEERLNRSIIRRNRLYTDTGTRPFLQIQRDDESVELVMEDNTVYPYQAPPPPPDPRNATPIRQPEDLQRQARRLDWDRYLDFLEGLRFNYVRNWIIWSTGSGTAAPPHKIASPMPFRRTGPGTAHDEAFFQRLHDHARDLQERGIYLSIMLFELYGFLDGEAVEGQRLRDGNLFNRANNVSGIDVDRNHNRLGEEFFSLDEPRVVSIPKASIEKMKEASWRVPT
jgi:hypothetical protein